MAYGDEVRENVGCGIGFACCECPSTTYPDLEELLVVNHRLSMNFEIVQGYMFFGFMLTRNEGPFICGGIMSEISLFWSGKVTLEMDGYFCIVFDP